MPTARMGSVWPRNATCVMPRTIMYASILVALCNAVCHATNYHVSCHELSCVKPRTIMCYATNYHVCVILVALCNAQRM